jgi:eukaryotic-like serine/threonine-protein kinase
MDETDSVGQFVDPTDCCGLPHHSGQLTRFTRFPGSGRPSSALRGAACNSQLSSRHRTAVAVRGSTAPLKDISKDGRVLLGLSADAKERDLSELDWSIGPILSEDGRTLVFTEEKAAAGAGYSVHLQKMDRSPAVRLGEGLALALSPDGKWVLAALVRSSPIPLVLLPTGAGESRPLPKDSINHYGGATFFPEGQRIIFDGSEPGHARRCWLQNLDGGKPRPVTPEGVSGSLLFPDGQFVVARGADQKPALYPIEGGPPRPIEGLESTDEPLRWSADGKFLFVRPRGLSLHARVYRVEVPSGRRELWKEFAPRDPTGLRDVAASSITPDGKTLVFTYHHTLSDLYVVEGLK